ncbi:MAG: FAD-binding protein, partial [Deltaproteobacteria bacterium]|nr:FAD-binding protein [Deltaproteobacteria bacterium]
METKVYDVIVVGAGNAALSAALSASEAGASVLILEKAPKSARGGNARYTAGCRFAYGDMKGFRALVPDLTDEEAERLGVDRYTVDDFYGDLMRISQGRADPEISMILAQESYPTVKWLVDMGVKLEVHYHLSWEKDGKRHFTPAIGMPCRPAGGGLGVQDYLFRIIEGRPGMEVRYETKAVKLLVDGTGCVCGVGVKDATGFHDVQARAVVLACGGFEASPEMRVKYLGPGWDMVKVRGSRYDTGEGLEMALDLGAAVSGQFSGCHASQVALSGPDMEMEDEAFTHDYHFGILVNVLGKRFVDEAADYRRHTYARLGREVRVQPRSIAFQIFDAKVTHLLDDRYQKARGVTARSLEELADELDID